MLNNRAATHKKQAPGDWTHDLQAPDLLASRNIMHERERFPTPQRRPRSTGIKGDTG
jgi:hypothetical protein